MVTDTNLLENTRRWRQTYKGLTANIYAKILERSRRNNRENAQFNLGEFREWLLQTDIHRLFRGWQRCGYKTDRRPSVDRIDTLRGYTFDNMQVITAKENRSKGDEEKIVLWGIPIHQISMSGTIVAKYPSIKVASQITGINRNNISTVINKKRKSAGGYKWEIIGNIYESPNLLTKENK